MSTPKERMLRAAGFIVDPDSGQDPQDASVTTVTQTPTPPEPSAPAPGQNRDSEFDRSSFKPMRALYEMPEVIDAGLAQHLGDFQTIDEDRARREMEQVSKNLEAVTGQMPEFVPGVLNFLQTAGESFGLGGQVSLARTASYMFGNMKLHPYTLDAFTPERMEGALAFTGQPEGAVREGMAALVSGTIQAPGTFAEYMRGVTWAWKEHAENALIEARRDRGFDPEAFTSIGGGATGSVLHSMVISAMTGGRSLPGQAKGLLASIPPIFRTTGILGVFEGTASYEQDILEGASELEALAYATLKAGSDTFTETAGVGWLFRDHKTTLYRVANAAFGNFFEEIMQSASHLTIDYLAAGFERLKNGEGVVVEDTIYGKRMFQTFDEFMDFAKSTLSVAMIGSLFAGGTSFTIGGPVNRMLTKGFTKMGVPPETAEQQVARLMATATAKFVNEVSTEAGVSPDKVSLTNRKINKALGVQVPARPDAKMDRVDLRGADIIEVTDDPVLAGRLNLVNKNYTELSDKLRELDTKITETELLDTEVSKGELNILRAEQSRVADALADAVYEYEAITSGRAIYATTAERQQLVDEGFVPISPDSELLIPAKVRMDIQTKAAARALANYKIGVADAKKELNAEGLFARRVFRDYVKSIDGLEGKHKERLQRKMAGIKNTNDLNRALNSVAPVIARQIDKMQERALKQGIDDIVRRYRKSKRGDVETKKIFDRVLLMQKDPSLRMAILEKAAQEGVEPGDKASYIEVAMARYYSKMSEFFASYHGSDIAVMSTVPELAQTYTALSALYSEGAAAANRILAQRDARKEKNIENLVAEINAPEIKPGELATGVTPSKLVDTLAAGRQLTMLEQSLMYNTLARVLVSGRKTQDSEALGSLLTYSAEMAQYAMEGTFKDRLKDAYRTSFMLKDKYGVTRQMQRDGQDLPSNLAVPLFDVKGEVSGYMARTTVARARTIWTYWQNSKARAALEKIGITDASIDFIETNILTQQDMEFIAESQRIMWDIYVLAKPVYERLTQKPLGFEEFYLPLLTNQDDSGAEVTSASNLIADMFQRLNIQSPYPQPSAVKQRTGGQSAVVQNDFNLLQKYIRDMSHFTTMSETLLDLNNMFTDPRVKNAVIKKFGSQRYDNIMATVDAMVRNSTWSPHNKGWRFFDRFVDRLALGAIEASGPKLGILQLSSSMIAWTELSHSEFIDGVIAIPEAIATGKMNALKNHPFYKYRGFDNFNVAMRMINDANLRVGDLSAASRLQDVMAYFMTAGDHGGVAINTYIMYDAFVKRGIPPQQALDKAFEISNTNQQSGFMSQMPVGAITGGSLMKSFFKFKSTPNQYFNNMYIAGAEYAGARARGKQKGGLADIFAATFTGPEARKLAKFAVMYHIVQPLLYNFISNAGRIDLEDQIYYTAMGPAAHLAFSGELMLRSLHMLGIAYGGIAGGGDGFDERKFWEEYNKLGASNILIGFVKNTGRLMQLVGEAAEDGLSWQDAAEITTYIGRAMTIKYPTIGAATQWLSRGAQGTGDIMEDDYESGLRRYLGYTSWAIDQLGKGTEMKKSTRPSPFGKAPSSPFGKQSSSPFGSSSKRGPF